MAAAFLLPVPDAPSGGHAFNAAVIAAWPGPAPAPVPLAGPWPRGDRASLAALREALRRPGPLLVDGLVAAAAPDLLAEAAARGTRIVLLVHLPLADEGGLPDAERRDLEQRERRSLDHAWRVVATSRTAARDLARRSGRDDIVAVPPGVDRAAPALPHEPPGLLQVGSIGPRKNQLATLDALRACRDLPWTAAFVGPVADEAYAREFEAGLADARATWLGPLAGTALADAYAVADLLVHPARAETFGMVVTEALARGLPAVVAAGTGAVEALGSGSPGSLPGAAVCLDRPDDLARTLRRWLTDSAVRSRWRERARLARTGLRGWPEAAADLARVLEPA